jgi:CBS domain-containing protein
VSVALVAIYQALAWFFEWLTWEELALICEWLSLANLTLVVFNMFPGYPLDGGRVLRALLWMKSGRLRRATYISSRIGIGFAWLLSGLGLWLLLIPPHRWNGFIFVLIGMFLRNAAEGGYQNAVQREILAGLCVGDLMTRSPIAIPEHLPISRAVDEFFLANHHAAFPVCTFEGEFRGLLRLDVVAKIPRERWPYVSAGDAVAETGRDDATIDASVPAASAMRLLLASGGDRLAVIENGRLIGILTRADLLRSIEIRTALET